MTTIDAENRHATLINFFTVEPARQTELVRLLDRATNEVMRHREGFISANIHASTDGTHVVNYAQWASEADFQAMLADPECQEHMTAARAIAEAIPRIYTVESTHHR